MAVRKPTPGFVKQFVDPQIADVDVPQTTVTDITDSSGGSGAAGGTVAAGVGISYLPFQLDLVDIANGDLYTDIPVGFKFKVVDTYFVCSEAVTTAAKAATLSLDIGTTAVTGSSLALTSANCTPAGANVTSSTAMAANTGSASDTLTLKAASVTAFGEGKGTYMVVLQNMDTADAFAVVIAQLASLKAKLDSAGVFDG